MPGLGEHASASIVRMLNIGESKTGKTGALASLAKAGYYLWILDYDNGLDILANSLRDDPDAMKRVQYETLRDNISFTNGIPRLKPPITAYKGAGLTLQRWKVEEFTDKDIIVLDTLTHFSQAAFNEATMAAGRLNQRPQQQDYGWMADSVKLFIEMLTDDSLKCHLIVNTHIRFLASDADETIQRGLPNAKGQEITRTVSTYFNTVVLTRSVGQGQGTKRQISTQPQGVVEVATSNPKAVKPSYPIETGLADLFKDILGKTPTQEK